MALLWQRIAWFGLLFLAASSTSAFLLDVSSSWRMLHRTTRRGGYGEYHLLVPTAAAAHPHDVRPSSSLDATATTAARRFHPAVCLLHAEPSKGDDGEDNNEDEETSGSTSSMNAAGADDLSSKVREMAAFVSASLAQSLLTAAAAAPVDDDKKEDSTSTAEESAKEKQDVVSINQDKERTSTIDKEIMMDAEKAESLHKKEGDRVVALKDEFAPEDDDTEAVLEKAEVSDATATTTLTTPDGEEEKEVVKVPEKEEEEGRIRTSISCSSCCNCRRAERHDRHVRRGERGGRAGTIIVLIVLGHHHHHQPQ